MLGARAVASLAADTALAVLARKSRVVRVCGSGADTREMAVAAGRHALRWERAPVADPVVIGRAQHPSFGVRVGDTLAATHDVRDVLPALDALVFAARFRKRVSGRTRLFGVEDRVGMTGFPPAVIDLCMAARTFDRADVSSV